MEPVVVRLGFSEHGFSRLLHDYECAEQIHAEGAPYLPRVLNRDGTLRNAGVEGLPETEKMFIADSMPLNSQWQVFCYEVFKYFAVGMTEDTLKKRWANFMHGGKFITDFRGSDTNADYINGTNLDKPPMERNGLTTCGNVVNIVGKQVQKGGVLCYPVECIDILKSPPKVSDVIYKPWLIHRATTVRYERVGEPTAGAPNGIYRVDPFPHLNGGDACFPLIAKGGVNWIADIRLKSGAGSLYV